MAISMRERVDERLITAPALSQAELVELHGSLENAVNAEYSRFLQAVVPYVSNIPGMTLARLFTHRTAYDMGKFPKQPTEEDLYRNEKGFVGSRFQRTLLDNLGCIVEDAHFGSFSHTDVLYWIAIFRSIKIDPESASDVVKLCNVLRETVEMIEKGGDAAVQYVVDFEVRAALATGILNDE